MTITLKLPGIGELDLISISFLELTTRAEKKVQFSRDSDKRSEALWRDMLNGKVYDEAVVGFYRTDDQEPHRRTRLKLATMDSFTTKDQFENFSMMYVDRIEEGAK